MSAPAPPRWLERLAERALPEGLSGEGALGDLAEEFGRRAAGSPVRARLWYAGQVASIVFWGVAARRGADRRTGAPDLLADLRWGVRLVARHPGFAAGVVAVLGLGLGANVAVFSVVDGTFRNTSWWAEPDRTLGVWPEREWSFGILEMYRERQEAWRALGGWTERAVALRTPDGGSESVNAVAITPELFRQLAARPAMGRPLADDDARLGVEPVAVVAGSLWRRSLGGRPEVVGSTVDVGGRTVRVVGVLEGANGAPGGRAELWMPLLVDPRDDEFFRTVDVRAVGVLAAGVPIEAARDEVGDFNAYLARTFPAFFAPDWDQGMPRVARADASQRRFVSTPLLLLLGGTALLLVVTALNVGNLLLGRAVERRRELAVRAAIGAGRGRIVGQLLVEAAVLVVPAMALALAAGAAGGPWIGELFVGEAVVATSPVTSPRVLGFGAAAAGTAFLVLAGVPVAHYLRSHGGGLSLVPLSGVRAQRALVAVQAALATLLLVSATLLVASVENLRDVPLGFEPADLLTVQLSLPEDRVADTAVARGLYDGLVERVSAVPGVRSVGLTARLPLRSDPVTTPINLETSPVDQVQATNAPLHAVDPGFFRALGVELLEGRLLDLRDRADAPSAVVVNRTLADMLWPDVPAVGQRVAIDPHRWGTFVPVVGVVSDVRAGDITSTAPEPALYVALAESPSRDVSLLIRAASGVDGLVLAVRNAVSEADPAVPVRAVEWMDDVVRAAYSVSWVIMGLLVALAALATGLGTLGVYAVLARHVAATRRDIGVRLALGAAPARVVAGVVGQGVLTAASGVAAGCVAAALAAKALESVLFGVSSLAPWAYAAPAAVLCVAALVAAWIPAARAGRLLPAEALRSEW